MMYLKGCPRCGGDLVPESDIYGPYLTCLQCGSMVDQVATGRPLIRPHYRGKKVGRAEKAGAALETMRKAA